MKYIVEADGHVQMISLTAVQDGTAIMTTRNIDTFQTADKALEEAYEMGYDEAKRIYQNPNAESDFQNGLNTAWDVAKKIALMDTETSENATGYFGLFRIMEHLTPMQAIEKLKAYEEQQKADAEIKVGDEVEAYSGRAIVFSTSTDKEGKKFCRYWYPSEERFNMDKTENLKKTGRYFPQVAELLEAMKGEQRDCHTCKHQVASSIECVDCHGFGKWESKEGAE